MERLLLHSLDVFYTPIFMKKNRPAYKLSVICSKDKEEDILDIIFKNTTTIGVRKYDITREILERNIILFNSSFGKINLKIVNYKNFKYIYPEYEDLKKIAIEKDLDIMYIYREVVKEYEEKSKLNL